MTDNNHPITPPPALVKQWAKQMLSLDGQGGELAVDLDWFATQAARWGADQELEACCKWMANRYGEESHAMGLLRAARRPKPPSLAQRALHILGMYGDLSPKEHSKLTHFLEALSDD